jgi:hypothetical protein
MACNKDILEVLAEVIPEDVYLVIGVANDRVNNNNPVVTDDNTFIIESMIGWKVRLIRNGSPQFMYATSDGDSWFEFSSILGQVTVSQNLGNGEKLIIQAYKPA